MRKINKIIIHNSDSPDTLDIGVTEIRQWHLQKGWNDIGYHYCVRREGTIEKGRDERLIGAHVAGQNIDSIGICMVGRKNFTKQLPIVYGIVSGLLTKYNLKVKDVYGHYEFDSKKTCPSIPMDKFRASLQKFIDDKPPS